MVYDERSHTVIYTCKTLLFIYHLCWRGWFGYEFIKPVLIVFKFSQFSAHSSSTKKFEIINFKWLKHKATGADFYCVFWSVEQTFFSYRFAVVYGTELSFTSNECSGLVTWQMLMSRAVLFVTRDSSKPSGVSSVYEISFQTHR